jgi:hypothetical protein
MASPAAAGDEEERLPGGCHRDAQIAVGRGSGPFPQRVGDRTDAGGRDLAEHQREQ